MPFSVSCYLEFKTMSSYTMQSILTCSYVHPRFETLDGNAVLQLDPAIPGVFNGPYPLGIDPVKACTLITGEK